jgi:hypothetical protein
MARHPWIQYLNRIDAPFPARTEPRPVTASQRLADPPRRPLHDGFVISEQGSGQTNSVSSVMHGSFTSGARLMRLVGTAIFFPGAEIR